MVCDARRPKPIQWPILQQAWRAPCRAEPPDLEPSCSGKPTAAEDRESTFRLLPPGILISGTSKRSQLTNPASRSHSAALLSAWQHARIRSHT